MLSNNTFLETRIQQLLGVLFFVEKGLGMNVQCMLKMSRFYRLAEILSKILVKKRRKIENLYTIMVWQINDSCQIYNAITACTTYTFTFGKCWLKEKWSTFKNGSFSIFLYTFTTNCITTGAWKMPIEYMFCFICKERCIKINSSRNKCGLYSSAFKKFIPNIK